MRVVDLQPGEVEPARKEAPTEARAHLDLVRARYSQDALLELQAKMRELALRHPLEKLFTGSGFDRRSDRLVIKLAPGSEELAAVMRSAAPPDSLIFNIGFFDEPVLEAD